MSWFSKFTGGIFPSGNESIELRAVLIGSKTAIKYSPDNILLGQSRETPDCLILRKLPGWPVSIFDLTGVLDHESCTDFQHLHLFESGIHAIILVIHTPHTSSGSREESKWTDDAITGIDWIQKVFGEAALDHTIVLCTYEGYMPPSTVKLQQNTVIQQLLQKCSGRIHTCRQQINFYNEISDLMRTIQFMSQRKISPFVVGRDVVQPSVKSQSSVDDEEKPIQHKEKEKLEERLEDKQQLRVKESEELRAVLIGSDAAVQYSHDNLLLGQGNFKSDCLIPKKFLGLSVFDMLGILDLTPYTNNKKCLPLFENGVHAIIMVVVMPYTSYEERKWTDDAKIGIDWIQKAFGEIALDHTIFLCTYEGSMSPSTVELQQNTVIQQLLQKCSGRIHTCRKQMDRSYEISDLMRAIQSMSQREISPFVVGRDVMQPSVKSQSSVDDEESRTQHKEKEKLEEKLEDKQQSRVKESEELRAVLIGSDAAVQYSHDNLLLGQGNFKSDCLIPKKFLGLSVFDMLGILDLTSYTNNRKYLPLFESGVHAIIMIVVMPHTSYEERKWLDDAETGLDRIRKQFGEAALDHSIVLCTYDEHKIKTFLDNPEEIPAIQQLLQKCSGRVHMCRRRMNLRNEIIELIKTIETMSQRRNSPFVAGTEGNLQHSVKSLSKDDEETRTGRKEANNPFQRMHGTKMVKKINLTEKPYLEKMRNINKMQRESDASKTQKGAEEEKQKTEKQAKELHSAIKKLMHERDQIKEDLSKKLKFSQTIEKKIEELQRCIDEKQDYLISNKCIIEDQILQIKRNKITEESQQERKKMLEEKIKQFRREEERMQLELTSKIQALEQEEATLKDKQRQKAEIESELKKMRSEKLVQLQTLDQEIESKNEKIKHQEEEILSNTPRSNRAKELQRCIDETQDFINHNESIIENQIHQIERNRKTEESQQERMKTLEEKLAEKRKQFKREEKRMQLELMSKIQAVEQTEATLKHKQRQKAETESELRKMQSEMLEQQLKNDLIKDEIDINKSQLSEIMEHKNKCENNLLQMKETLKENKKEIEWQSNVLTEQNKLINTQSEEIKKQNEMIMNQEKVLRRMRNKKRNLEQMIKAKERHLQLKEEKIQKDCQELERQKKRLEQKQRLMKIEKEGVESRMQEEDMKTLEGVEALLENIISSKNYQQEDHTLKTARDSLRRIRRKTPTVEKTDKKSTKTNDALETTGSAEDKSLNMTRKPKQHEDSLLGKSSFTIFYDFIQRLGLDIYYHPSKLTTETVHTLMISKEKLQSDSSVAFIYLQKLLMLNYKARFISEDHKQTNVFVRSGEESLDSCFSEVFEDDVSNETTQIHPMDVQMALFHCADRFLRQYVVTKLSSCQYALPLLVPNPHSAEIEFSLWTFRQIKKSWISAEGSSRTLPVWQIKTPMVCFYRLGSVSTSKSQLLNSLINPKHDTFFHRDCPGSSRTRLLMEGLVEIAWYCPAGNNDDIFSECIAFCNLHGDAAGHKETVDFLDKVATINIVLMQNLKLNAQSKKMLQELHKSPKPLICLVRESKPTGFKMGKSANIKIGLESRNMSEIQKELITSVKMCFEKCGSENMLSLHEISKLATENCIRVDENAKSCHDGKIQAVELIEQLEKEGISQIKERFLPCQGKLLHAWTKKNKELYRLSGHVEDNRSKIKGELDNLRKQQKGLDIKFMQNFTKILSSQNVTQKKYFLHWVKILINERFSEHLSEVNLKYNCTWLELQKMKSTQNHSKELTSKHEELENISTEIERMTVGLEHIMREMGQIYEAWASQPDETSSYVSTLPALAAELLISGHPLELMDGDAAHVPLIWIQSVLDSVINRLGDQRLYVLSVLGLQSSGKSTMLNAMFGLQFAVSAGRCTRGAFMQLIKVKEEFREELKFDFLLAVDTEGLQALELIGKATFNHDNELATFVIGLANLTLINVFGENPAEIHGVLQIAIQALLRMKKVKLKPSCIFVHQNVTDIAAAEKNMEGRRRLQEKLDEMTVSIAKEEGCHVNCFSDVIKFDIQKDVHYFAQLWEGNPPMAPPNPRYSENIEKLKEDIFKAAAQQQPLRLSELKVRIKDLWSAVLSEDFVFSFKNTLEIAAYKKLEVMYGNWTWALRSGMLAIENKLHNRIGNEKFMLINEKQIHEEIDVALREIQKQMETFFTNDKDAEILVQWRARTEKKMEELKNALVEGTKEKFDYVVQQKEKCKMLDKGRLQYENELFNKSINLASRLKGQNMDEGSLRREFDSMWKKWLLDLRREKPSVEPVNVEEEMLKTLSASFQHCIVQSRIQTSLYKTIFNKEEYSAYVKVNKQEVHSPFHHSLNPEDHNAIRELVKQTVRDVEEIMNNATVANMGYSNAYTQEILNKVKKRVAEFGSKKFVFKHEFTVDLSLYVCSTIINKYTDLQKVFMEMYDPLIYLDSMKKELFSSFKQQYNGVSATNVFADFVCKKMKTSLQQAVCNKAALDATGEMKANFPAFSGNRSNLEKHILQDLAVNENFKLYMSYIHQPKQHFSDFIERSVRVYMFEGETSRIKQILTNLFKMKLLALRTAIQKVTEDVKQRGGGVEKWLERFSLELRDELKFTVSDLHGAQYQEVTDTELFSEAMQQAVQAITEDLFTNIVTMSSGELEKIIRGMVEILNKQLCGCWVQCPFCKAICTNTIEGHDGDHSVPFHRPDGINGCRWHKTENLSVEICTSLVASDLYLVLPYETSVPYKKYREAGPDYACWTITPETSEQPYWKWFVCRFQKDIERRYSETFQGRGAIPGAWKKITKEEAIKKLWETGV